MNQQGILVVVSGFSGAGKGTLMKELLRRYDNYAFLSPLPQENPERAKKTEENTSSFPRKSLKSCGMSISWLSTPSM